MRFVILLFALMLSACATVPTALKEHGKVELTLSEVDQDKWLLTADFDRPQSHLIFASSDGNFRNETWKLISPGRLKSEEGVDSIHFDPPTQQMSFEITPTDGRVRMSRYPFFRFSDGGTIILSKQFYMVPADSEKQVSDLKGDLTKWRGFKIDHALRLATPQLAYVNGEVVSTETWTKLEQDSKFIFVGPTGMRQYDNFRGTIDSNLPAWVSQDVDANIGKIIESLEQLFGTSLPRQPDLFFMGDPDSEKYFAYSGVAFPGQTLALKVEGDALRKESQPIFHEIMFFYAHEISHLFQHIEDVGRTTEEAAWISEGSANLMGHRALAKAGLTDNEFTNRELRNAYKSCRAVLAGDPLPAGRSLVQARYYDCGLMISLITEAALPDDDIFTFWSALTSAALDAGGVYNGDLYYELMHKRGADKNVTSALKNLIASHIENSENPLRPDLSIDLDTLLNDVGLSPRFARSGALIDMVWE